MSLVCVLNECKSFDGVLSQRFNTLLWSILYSSLVCLSGTVLANKNMGKGLKSSQCKLALDNEWNLLMHGLNVNNPFS
jgi:hypothetical protein